MRNLKTILFALLMLLFGEFVFAGNHDVAKKNDLLYFQVDLKLDFEIPSNEDRKVFVQVFNKKGALVFSDSLSARKINKINLPLGENYAVYFDKKGYFKKKIEIDAPSVKSLKAPVAFKFSLTMMSSPFSNNERYITMAKLHFNTKKQYFEYDEKYSKTSIEYIHRLKSYGKIF